MYPSTLLKHFLVLKHFLALVLVMVVALVATIALGGPKEQPPMSSISDPFKTVEFSDLPPLQRYNAEDGAALAYRYYVPAADLPKGSVVLVHGSSASSNSMHLLAKAFAKAGYKTYALDIRGHGASGVKGTIDHVGQLEDDLGVFVNAISLTKPATLVGFSSGGGFVLRFAGSKRQAEFQSYLLFSPFLGPDAPNYRPGAGGWVNVGIPRIVGLSVLNRLGIHVFNGLAVTNFALGEEAKKSLTSAYSFSLAANFQPQRDYEANIRAVHIPVAVVAGANDEIFVTSKLEGDLSQAGPILAGDASTRDRTHSSDAEC